MIDHAREGRSPVLLAAIAALLAPLLFPWPLAVLAAIPIALMEPVAAFVCGVWFDLLYYAPGVAHVPYGTVLGAVGTIVAFVVRRFVKTRIIGG